MTSPQPGHLVERAVERLLQSGALDGSVAQLLEADRSPSPPSEPPPDAPTSAAPVSISEPIQEIPKHPASPAISLAALQKAGLFDLSRGRSRISEEFRLAQRQLLRKAFATSADPGVANLVMVTSARPGEGKTFTALNLAGCIAQQGDHRVLLIDCDSKRESLCRMLGLGDASGVLDLAANARLDPDDIILPTEVAPLSILPIGQDRSRSSELFASREMGRLMHRLGRRYSDRLLILDAGPCLSTGDPAALAHTVGQTLLVVEAERTQRDEVEAALDLIQACPVIMLLLNKVQVSNRNTFGAYSDYYAS